MMMIIVNLQLRGVFQIHCLVCLSNVPVHMYVYVLLHSIYGRALRFVDATALCLAGYLLYFRLCIVVRAYLQVSHLIGTVMMSSPIYVSRPYDIYIGPLILNYNTTIVTCTKPKTLLVSLIIYYINLQMCSFIS